MNLVTVHKFAEMSGYTEQAVQSKIDRGDWIEGREYVKAPDGRRLINIRGYEQWATRNHLQKESGREAVKFGSTSRRRPGASAKVSGYRIPPRTESTPNTCSAKSD